MSGLFTSAQIALETRLASMSGAPAIAFENVNYTPVEGTTYLQPNNLIASGKIETLSNLQENKGIFQVDIYVPTEKGTKAANTLIDAIYNHFHAQKLVSGSVSVEIMGIRPKHMGLDGAWWKSFVEINYRYYST